MCNVAYNLALFIHSKSVDGNKPISHLLFMQHSKSSLQIENSMETWKTTGKEIFADSTSDKKKDQKLLLARADIP